MKKAKQNTAFRMNLVPLEQGNGLDKRKYGTKFFVGRAIIGSL